MQLFIKYQIPSDLLSYDEDSRAVAGARAGAGIAAAEEGCVAEGPAGRVSVVRAHVAAMQEMIEAAQKQEVEERNREREYREGQARAQEEALLRRLREQAESMREQHGIVFGSAPQSFAQGMSMDVDQVQPAASYQNKSGGMGIGGLGGLFGASGSAPPAPAPAACVGGGGPHFRSTARMPSTGLSTFAAQQSHNSSSSSSSTIGASQSRDGISAAVLGTQAGKRRAEPAKMLHTLQQVSRLEQQRQQQEQQPNTGLDIVTKPSKEYREDGEHISTVDYTQLPTQLDSQYERLDTDSALRPTIINPSTPWQKKSQAALLATPTTRSLDTEGQKSEKDAAFDLLDALTRSGAIALEHCALQVVIAATHCFDRSLMDTVVQRNVNPIERVERSVLIMASTLHGVRAGQLLQESQVARVSTFSPQLFDELEEEQQE